MGVNRNSFKGKVLVDIGCGPHGAIGKFYSRLRFGIDPLANNYHRLFDLSAQEIIYLSCGAESIPLIDGIADVVISRNALDHVDNFDASIHEIHRILRPGGEIRLSISYQERYAVTEPIRIDDNVIRASFDKRFSYEIIKRFPKDHDSGITGAGQFKYPYQIIMLSGHKLV